MTKLLTALALLAIVSILSAPVPASAAPSCEQVCVGRCASYTGTQKEYCTRKCTEGCYAKRATKK